MNWRSGPESNLPGAARQLTNISGLAATGSQEICPVSGALIEQGRCSDGHQAGLDEPPLKSSDSWPAWEFSQRSR